MATTVQTTEAVPDCMSLLQPDRPLSYPPESVGEGDRLGNHNGRRRMRGQKTREAIVEAAISVLREVGYAGFSLQRVTDKLGISLGNLTYHFPARTDLIDAMVARMLAYYEARIEQAGARVREAGPERLEEFIDWLLDDAVARETVEIFPELWAMANHQPQAAEAVERIYVAAISTLMRALDLEPYDARAASFRSAAYLLAVTVEGMTAVFGRRGTHDERFLATKTLAKTMLMPALRQALEDSRVASS